MKAAFKDAYPFTFRAGFLEPEVRSVKVANLKSAVRGSFIDLEQFLWVRAKMTSKDTKSRIS